MAPILCFGSESREKCRSVAAVKNDRRIADALVSGRDVCQRVLVTVMVCLVMSVAGCVTANPRAPASSTGRSTQASYALQPRSGSIKIIYTVLVEGVWREFQRAFGLWNCRGYPGKRCNRQSINVRSKSMGYLERQKTFTAPVRIDRFLSNPDRQRIADLSDPFEAF